MSKKKWWNMFVEFEGEGPHSAGSGGGPPDAEDIDALLARTRALTQEAGVPTSEAPDAPPPPPSAPSPSPPSAAPQLSLPPATGAASTIAEGTPLAQIYAAEGCVPPSPKTVEEIVMFLDGLKAMPVTVQQQALEAMDNADTSWSIDDVLVDAQNKIEALRRATEGLSGVLDAAQYEVQSDIDNQAALIAKATSTIDAEIEEHRNQIAELESLRDQEIQAAELAQEQARERLLTSQHAAGREAARYQTEMDRLARFVATFDPTAGGRP